ncbi:MAG: ferritin-like domain-containing protein [Archangium sp.]|nr:ferritin-like domain-containing protein [Archangium sp.]MDP3154495.1 ferritin-like domain-containing protein [Archangium sp.]MDP3572900.1 ferritin-like domain-containing protein [Archangium sp.]
MTERPNLSNITTLRERARKHIEGGAVIDEYKADRAMVIKLLDEALATEIVCSLRYKRHYFTAHGLASLSVAEEFLEHARQEDQHAERFAARICELGGAPNFSPHGLAERSHAEYVEGHTLMDMIREDLVAERIAIESYREIITYLGNDDPTTRRLFEDILAVEEEHAEDLASLTSRLGKEEHSRPSTPPVQG